jgi:CHAD domain-containing protein
MFANDETPLSSSGSSDDKFFGRFTLKNTTSLDLLSSHLTSTFEVIRHPSKKESLGLYDTHVWTLWFENVILIKSRRNLSLQAREGDWPVGRALATIPWKASCPRFAGSFPPSLLHDQLDDLLGHRSLYQIAEINETRHEWNLRNTSSKTVVRLQIREMSSQAGTSIFAELHPLRGYSDDAHIASRLVSEIADASGPGPLGLALRAHDAAPVPYVLKPELKFSPTQSTRTAVCEAALKTLIVARSNENGMLHDWDSEFLHDYRVCLRRIRSVLSSIKGIFPEEKLIAWKDLLGRVSRHTNKLRDLDVYLLSRNEMTELLPEELRPGLTSFFSELVRERKSEFRKLKTYLHSPAYHEAMTSLERAFAHPEELAETEHSAAPIITQAARRILKRFQRLTRLAEALDKDAPDSEIHLIRIAGKKLRYLLEFFGDLFPSEEINTLTKLLSKLQSCLGEFNDTSVQQDYLLKYAQSRSSTLDARLAMSLGGLVAALYREHGALKKEVRRALKKFCSEANVEAISPFATDLSQSPA